MATPSIWRLLGIALPVLIPAFYLQRKVFAHRRRRDNDLKPTDERVLVIGASSGVGRAVAKQYVARGARVCVVARRGAELAKLAAECGGDRCIWEAAEFTDPQQMVRLRDRLLREWGGLDTVHVCAGVSALQPVMALTDVEGPGEDAGVDGIQKAVGIAGAAVKGNFDGPLISALTFIPMLTRTSSSPAILLVSSLAAVIPAPTRALYAATKASSLLLYQALAIEHPRIAFGFMLPSTIEGNFRASAVDSGPVREADPNKSGLKLDYVARKCIEAVDWKITGNIFLPWFPYALGHHIYYLFPSFVERQARKKYNFSD